MHLEIIILAEINQTCKLKYCMISFMRNPKYKNLKSKIKDRIGNRKQGARSFTKGKET